MIMFVTEEEKKKLVYITCEKVLKVIVHMVNIIF